VSSVELAVESSPAGAAGEHTPAEHASPVAQSESNVHPPAVLTGA
jgi:hypothetical protein